MAVYERAQGHMYSLDGRIQRAFCHRIVCGRTIVSMGHTHTSTLSTSFPLSFSIRGLLFRVDEKRRE
ncbi:hypothetical protein OUZ56_005202 [Daphnia magna]|uniref:Uncharacterized protein n=1 Tax=Daphnia magna TaxID=35525 RepID=A0ABQ9YS43_9CRUS|nr:hypothetical protein OUZ56_005202 [Daphnia magna]